jgi:hypothetical protein
MRDLYIKNGQGFVIVYSITSEGTFDELHKVYNQIMTTKVKKHSYLFKLKNIFTNRKNNHHWYLLEIKLIYLIQEELLIEKEVKH